MLIFCDKLYSHEYKYVQIYIVREAPFSASRRGCHKFANLTSKDTRKYLHYFNSCVAHDCIKFLHAVVLVL
jgi:hypothetical protein